MRAVWLPALAMALLACDTQGGDGACTLIGCVNGVTIEFTLREAGSYVVTVDAGGQKTTCMATLPLSGADTVSPCDREGVILTRSGSALPAAQQSLGGLFVSDTTASSITVKITRDGATVREQTFTPQYSTSRPNGPNCDPVCTQATHTLSG